MTELESLLELLVPLPGDASFADQEKARKQMTQHPPNARGADLLDDIDDSSEEEAAASSDDDDGDDDSHLSTNVVAHRTRSASGKSAPSSPRQKSTAKTTSGKGAGKAVGKAAQAGKKPAKAAKKTKKAPAGKKTSPDGNSTGEAVTDETSVSAASAASASASAATGDSAVQINVANLAGPIRIRETPQNSIMIAKLLENGRLLQNK